MQALFDTHVLVWDFLDPSRLSLPATEALTNARGSNGVMIADISLWEIAMLIEKGRLTVGIDSNKFIRAILDANGATVLPITPKTATLSVQLPNTVNKDPADRLLVATAQAENIPLVTADRNLQSVSLITTIW